MSAAVIELPDPSYARVDRGRWDHSVTPDEVLRRAALALAPDGVLLAAIHAASLTFKLWRRCTSWFEILALGQLVDEKQVVTGVIFAGRMQPRFVSTDTPPLPNPARLPALTTLGTPLAHLPAAPRASVQFSATYLTWEQAIAEARPHGVWADPSVSGRLVPNPGWTVRPLMPLSKGHLGQLIACGAFNNALLHGPDGPVLLKGQTHRLRSETGSATEPAAHGDPVTQLTTMRDAFRTTVTLLQLRSGDLHAVHSEDGDDGDRDDA